MAFERLTSPRLLMMSSALLLSLWTGACSPQPKARYFKPIKMEFGPTQTEVDLGELKPQQNPSAASLTWQGEIATEQWMSLIEDLTTLALQRRDDRVARLVDRMRLNVEVAGNVVQLHAVSLHPRPSAKRAKMSRIFWPRAFACSANKRHRFDLWRPLGVRERIGPEAK
jgi:hypothetical protein